MNLPLHHLPTISLALQCLLTGIFLSLYSISHAQIINNGPQKQLIEFGWHSPYLNQYADEPAKYDIEPFDGTTLKISEAAANGYVFRVNDWKAVDLNDKQRNLDWAKQIGDRPSQRANFLVLYGASQMDWFSEEDWDLVEDQLRYTLSVAKAAQCRGLLWDPEPYGSNPWKFAEQKQFGKRSLEDFVAIIRKRGRQFVEVVEREMPDAVILSLRELSDFQSGSPFSSSILPMRDKNAVMSEIEHGYWGLHIAFYNGMIEGMIGKSTLIDGNEEAYYYTSANEYDRVRTTLAVDALALVDSELWTKHRAHHRLGQAIATSYPAGEWLTLSFPKRLSGQANMLTPKERGLWLQHNTYHALRTADQFAWLYTESQNWFTGERVPDGFLDAVAEGKKKAINRQPLVFSIETMMETARNKAEAHYANATEGIK